jgi:hypothetical protein
VWLGISESNSMCRQKIHLFAKSREFGFSPTFPTGVLNGRFWPVDGRKSESNQRPPFANRL